MTEKKSKDLWEFPCNFPVKIVGKSNDDFETLVYSILHKHFPDLSEGALQTRKSNDGTYLAITAHVHALSKEQLDALYLELTSNKQVLFAL